MGLRSARHLQKGYRGTEKPAFWYARQSYPATWFLQRDGAVGRITEDRVDWILTARSKEELRLRLLDMKQNIDGALRDLESENG